MKKILSLMMVLAILLTACGSDGDKKDAKDTGKVDKSETLLIYSNSASDGRGEWLTERAKKEGFNIEVVPIPGGELTNRVIAEKNNSQADLIYGLNALEYEKLKAEDLLAKYEPTWKSDVDMSLGDEDGYYYPIVIQPLVLMYEEGYKDAPSDWTELTDAKYKDKYSIAPLTGGTSKTILASILIRYADEKGELGISKEGWDVVKKYVENAHIQVQGEDFVGEMIEGKYPMLMMWGSGVMQHQEERNMTFDVMQPEVGMPYVTEQIGISSKSDKQALAEEFANWFGSAEIQGEWSKEFGTIPAQEKALETSSDDVKAFMEKVKPQDMDWELIAKYIDQWVEKVELEMVK